MITAVTKSESQNESIKLRVQGDIHEGNPLLQNQITPILNNSSMKVVNAGKTEQSAYAKVAIWRELKDARDIKTELKDEIGNTLKQARS